MSLGGELSVIMPVINAPFRLYFAYNPLRLYEKPYCNLGTGRIFKAASSNSSLAICSRRAAQAIITYGEAIRGLRRAATHSVSRAKPSA